MKINWRLLDAKLGKDILKQSFSQKHFRETVVMRYSPHWRQEDWLKIQEFTNQLIEGRREQIIKDLKCGDNKNSIQNELV